MFEVAHCFLCCWQETASGSGFGDDSFPFYKIQKSLNKCNLSTNVLFWSNCNIVHVSVVFYFECPFRVNASLSFAVKECNSLLSWIMSLIVLCFSIVIWSWSVASSYAVKYFLSSFLMFLIVQGSSFFLYSSLAKTYLEIFLLDKRHHQIVFQ